MKTLTFQISEILENPTGTREQYSIDGPVEFTDFATKSNLKAKVEIMRIDKGVNVKVEDLEVDVDSKCVNCLKSFSEKIKLPFAERQFYIDMPDTDDPNDIFLINKKKHTIDLTEMLRQEIILHFSVHPVCSKSCKIKWKDPDISPDSKISENKPFAQLKELIKKHGKTSGSKEKNS